MSTGATIASKENPDSGLLSSGSLIGRKLVEKCNISKNIDVEVNSIFQVPSNHMTFEMLIELKEKIE